MKNQQSALSDRAPSRWHMMTCCIIMHCGVVYCIIPCRDSRNWLANFLSPSSCFRIILSYICESALGAYIHFRNTSCTTSFFVTAAGNIKMGNMSPQSALTLTIPAVTYLPLPSAWSASRPDSCSPFFTYWGVDNSNACSKLRNQSAFVINRA